MTITTIGLDTSKTWFQVHCVDADGRTVLRRKLARSKVLSFFANIPSCLVGLEACGGSHFWARELAKLGHDARLMPARYVRAYVKTNKHDAADAEACCEAVQRPGMRFVPVKTEEQQSMLMIHRARDLLVRQRTAAVNALRGHLAEFGIVAAKGTAKAHELMRLAGDDERLPSMAREALGYIVAQIHDIESRLKIFEQKDPVAREGRRGLQAAHDGAIDRPLYRHRDRRNRRRSSQFRLGTSFRSLAGTDPKTAFYGRKRKAWRNKQARRQLYPSVTHSWRSGDCGSRAERSDEKRLALRASEPAAFQRRHRRLGKQDSSSRMGGHVDRASLSKGRLIARRSIGFGCARANGRMMANRSDRNWLIPLALSGSKARQDNWAPVRVSHQGRQRSCAKDRIDSCSRALAKLPKKPLHRGDRP